MGLKLPSVSVFKSGVIHIFPCVIIMLIIVIKLKYTVINLT